jgi:SAM-dependent methyltransferase
MRNSSRTWLGREVEAFGAALPAGAVVLDAGAGEQPYARFFAHCTYEAADFEKVDKPYAKSTYVCDLGSIPVEDERFDAIIFNQVMEHLPEPLAVLKELRRVLKPQGVVMCTAPFFYEEHEQPYDFFRYTQFGWRHLMQKAGFEVTRLDWMEGYFGTLAYQLEIAARHLPRGAGRFGAARVSFPAALVIGGCRLLFRLLAAFFYRLDEQGRYTARGYPKNYLLIVRRGG